MPSFHRIARHVHHPDDDVCTLANEDDPMDVDDSTLNNDSPMWSGNRKHDSTLFNEVMMREYSGMPLPNFTSKLTSLARERRAEVAPFEMQESAVPTSSNKVFAAAWLDDDNAVVGTKDNKLMQLTLSKERQGYTFIEHELPRVASGAPASPTTSCGMHTCAVSSRRQLMATGGKRVQDIALFNTADVTNVHAVAVLRGHTDWVFTSDWSHAGTLVTGGKDHQFMIWRPPSGNELAPPGHDQDGAPAVPEVGPAAAWPVMQVIRDLKVHPNNAQTLVSLSTVGTVAVWDLTRGGDAAATFTRTLDPSREAVVLGVEPESGLIAAGTQRHIHLVDPRQRTVVQSVESVDEGWGVRSLSWDEHVLTIGGGFNRLSFYDVRAGGYLRDPTNPNKTYREVGREGFLRRDDVYHTVFEVNALPTPAAVYALARSPTGHELLACGGPTPFGLFGSFVSVLAPW